MSVNIIQLSVIHRRNHDKVHHLPQSHWSPMTCTIKQLCQIVWLTWPQATIPVVHAFNTQIHAISSFTWLLATQQLHRNFYCVLKKLHGEAKKLQSWTFIGNLMPTTQNLGFYYSLATDNCRTYNYSFWSVCQGLYNHAYGTVAQEQLQVLLEVTAFSTKVRSRGQGQGLLILSSGCHWG